MAELKAARQVDQVIRHIPWNRQTENIQGLLQREYLVSNGLGGYASGTLAGVCTRRHHGLLVAALPVPLGRVNMLSRCADELLLPDGCTARLWGEERTEGVLEIPGAEFLEAFELRAGLPVWRFRIDGFLLEKSLLLPYLQNTVQVIYRLLEGSQPMTLRLQPFMHFHPQAAEVSPDLQRPYLIEAFGNRFEVKAGGEFPDLRLFLHAAESSFNLTGGAFSRAFYRIEKERGYAAADLLWSPGFFSARLAVGEEAVLVASTEAWEILLAFDPAQAREAELFRRQQLVDGAPPSARKEPAVNLVLGSDQFVIAPVARVADAARAHARGDEVRSVIAGYHWFTDWGRDTMISLEGLTLATGRCTEAGYILRTFANYVRDGLIPNMFPEGDEQGVYYTSDATLWFFHAADRYLRATGDLTTLRLLLPVFGNIVRHHLRGTRFGIGIDPADGLLRQGDPGYPLTWMDAKAGDWIVTPRRGKPVEINALWYNALCIYREWLRAAAQGEDDPEEINSMAVRVRRSFNQRFWNPRGGYLYDLVDGEAGDDDALRPNQIFAISPSHPVLDSSNWRTVFDAVRTHLLTPAGLRTLAPGHPDYQHRYAGDVTTRDAAYHQGTVWPWLAGPFVDAWLRIYPDQQEEVRTFLEGIIAHLDDVCIGSISEVFDAEPPFAPKGCISQAWSVAEVLRAWIAMTRAGEETA